MGKSKVLISFVTTMLFLSCSNNKNIANNPTTQNLNINENIKTNTLINTTANNTNSISQIDNTNQSQPVTNVQAVVPKVEIVDTSNVISTIVNSDVKPELTQEVSSGNDFNTEEIKDSLVNYHDLDNIFSQSEGISLDTTDNNTSTFSTKSLDLRKRADDGDSFENKIIKANINNNDKKQYFSESIKNSRQELVELKKYDKKEQDFQLKNKEKLQDNSKANYIFNTRKEKVNCSKQVSYKGDDGNLVKKNEIEFKRDNNSKVNRVNKIYDKNNNKLAKFIHNYEFRNAKYTQTASRVITFNSDGGRNITTECVIKYTNGIVKMIEETRVLDRYGKGNGFGCIKINHPNGKKLVHNVNISCDNKSKISSVKDPVKNDEVKVIDDSSGSAQVVINNNITIINISDSTYYNTFVPYVSPSPSPTLTPTPVASATIEPTSTPVASIVPTPTATSTATIIPTSTPTPLPTATSTPTPIATLTPKATPNPTPTPTVKPTSSSECNKDEGKSTGKCDNEDDGEKNNNGLGDTKDSDNTTKGTDTSNPGQNKDS
ncbi:MAG: hypothetical protein U0457_20710 [Candidatus Sericytochromatia bacterium]